jgi:hypothetical protein
MTTLGDLATEIALELALLERKALDRVRRRNAEQQLGEAWVDLDKTEVDIGPREIAA